MKKRLLILCLLALLLAGCASPAAAPGPDPANRLVVYTSHKEEVYRPIIREFEERTGIWVELVTGGTTDLLQRIAQERSAPRADIMFGGGVESLAPYRELFRDVRCSEYSSIHETFREPEDNWTAFSALPVVLVFNTKLVDPSALTGWQDLLRPEYRGRIAFADPERSGSSFTALATAVRACGDEILEGLAANLDGKLLSSSGDVLSAVANGECLVGITLEETALQRIAAGDDLTLVYPKEGTSCIPDGTAVILGAPHGENAEKFLNFTLSRPVQQLLGSAFYRRSVRSDVAAPSTLRPLDKIPLASYDTAWAAQNRDRILQLWQTSREEDAQ